MSTDQSLDNLSAFNEPPSRLQIVPAIIADAGDLAIDAYLAFVNQSKWSPNTRMLYAQSVRQFFRWASERGLTLESIGANEVASYASELAGTKSPQVVSVYLSPIRGLFRHLVNEGVFFLEDHSAKVNSGRGDPVGEEWPEPKLPLEDLKRDVLEIGKEDGWTEDSEEFQAGLVMLAEFSINTRDSAAISHFTGVPESFVRLFAARLIENGIWLPDGKIAGDWNDPEYGGFAFMLDVWVATGELQKTFLPESDEPAAGSANDDEPDQE